MGLPTKYDVIICEGVREEKRGKLSILGLYAGDSLITDDQTPREKVNLKIVYLIRFKDGSGKWKATWKVLDKKGNKISPDVPELDFEKKDAGYAILVVEFLAHKVTEFGTYKFVFTVENKDYDFEYQINPGKVDK